MLMSRSTLAEGLRKNRYRDGSPTPKMFEPPEGITVVEPGDRACAHRWLGQTLPHAMKPTTIICRDCGQTLEWENGR